MKESGLIFIILCFIVFFAGCTINSEKSAYSESAVQIASKTDTEEDTDGNFHTNNCMIDDGGNLLVMDKDGYEPYTYDKLPNIPENLARIIKVLRESNNVVSLDYQDKLFLYYGLEKEKSRIVGGNGVDIFNFSIDEEKDIIAFSVEHLTFYDLIDDDYHPLLLETFNLLFGESGEDIYRYFMKFYSQPTDGVTDETRIDGMLVKYNCTPKHKLVISLVADE